MQPSPPAQARPKFKVPWLILGILLVPTCGGFLMFALAFGISHATQDGRVWADVSSPSVMRISPPGVELEKGRNIGKCTFTSSCRSSSTRVFASNEVEAAIDAHLQGLLSAEGFSSVPASATNPWWCDRLRETPPTHQFRKGELTVRYYVRATPCHYGRSSTLNPSDARHCVHVVVDNFSTVDPPMRCP
jgi:hypothetical protein